MCEPEEVLRPKRLTVLRDCFAQPVMGVDHQLCAFGINLEIADLNDTVHYALICKTRDWIPISSKLP